MDRLIVCQGTAQLATAISALRVHTKRMSHSQCNQSSRDHLLICGLSVSEYQINEFSDEIERMAALLHSFVSINRLTDSTLEQIIDIAKRGADAVTIAGIFQKLTGLGKMDEVFTVRDWQPLNELVLGAYPDATHICFGDSVGVYLPKGFMAPNPKAWSWGLAFLQRVLKFRKSVLDNPRVDLNYLLLPEAFGLPPSGEVIQTDASTLREVFKSLLPLLNSSELEEIRKKTAGRSVWVLLGSNFSEQGLMTPEVEVAAYRNWIESLCPELGAVLLIKSHPRDQKNKRAIIETGLAGLFGDMLYVDNVGTAYLPIEVLLLALDSVVGSLRCLTFSTACLGTHFVVGSKTDIGFGDALVARYIASDRQHQRLQHESDLRRLCTA